MQVEFKILKSCFGYVKDIWSLIKRKKKNEKVSLAMSLFVFETGRSEEVNLYGGLKEGLVIISKFIFE